MAKRAHGKRKAPLSKYSEAELEVLRAAAEDAATLGETEQPESTSSAPTGSNSRSEQSSTGTTTYVLDPTGLWFDHSHVKEDVVESIQGYYLHPWRSYTQVDEDTKAHWFNTFSHKYRWAPHLHRDVRRRFDAYATDRLRDMVHRVIKKGPDAENPDWISEGVHQQLLDIPSTDHKFMARSAQNKKNRRGGSMDTEPEPTHFQGSISALQHARKYASENDGRMPDAPDLFLRTHFKDVPGISVKVPVNRRAQATLEAYQQIQQQSQSTSSAEGSQRSANDMFFEATGGRNNKGRVRGLGKSASLYYGTSKSGQGSASSSDIHPSIMDRMRDQIRDELRSEMLADKEDLERTKLELLSQQEQMMSQQQAFMEEMMRRFGSMTPPTCSFIPPQPRDPTNDDDGSSGAGQGIPTVF